MYQEICSIQCDLHYTEDCTNYVTQPVWTLFLFKYKWTRSQGSQECQKIKIYFLQIKLLSFCAKIAPKRQKLIKIEKKKLKNLFSQSILNILQFWGQYQRTKPQVASLVDPGASFDTPGTPGGGPIQKESRFQSFFLRFLSGGTPYNFFPNNSK